MVQTGVVLGAATANVVLEVVGLEVEVFRVSRNGLMPPPSSPLCAIISPPSMTSALLAVTRFRTAPTCAPAAAATSWACDCACASSAGAAHDTGCEGKTPPTENVTLRVEFCF